MSEVLSNAGALGYLIMAGTLLGVVAVAALAGLAFTRRRVPLSGLMVFPYLVLAAGAFGAWVATATAGADVAAASADQIPTVAMSKAWASMAVDWVARWGAAVVLAAGVWAAAIGSAVVPGEEPRFTPWGAGLTAATAIGGAIWLAGYGAYSGFSSAFPLAGVVLVTGLGVAAAATRRAADDDMFRVAGMRFAASMCALFSIWHASRAIEIGNRMTAFDAASALMTTPEILDAIALYDAVIWPGMVVGFIGLLTGLGIAFHGFFTEIAEVAVRYTVFDVFAVVVTMVAVTFFRLLEMMGFNGLYAVATNTPAVEAYHELGPNLVSSLMTTGDTTTAARLAEGGFGDVWITQGETFVRLHRWTGTNWVETHDELKDVKNFGDRPPLVAIERTENAKRLLEMLEVAPNHQIFVLLRAAEVKPGVTVPAELERMQVTFLPLQQSTPASRDHRTQLWIEAGAAEANFGPTTCFGTGDDAVDLHDYAANALLGTQSPGVHVLAGERKVADVVGSCLNYLIDKTPPKEAGKSPGLHLSTRWCALAPEDFETIRAEAAAVTEIPNPDNVRLEVAVEGPLTLAEVDDRVRREMGGISYCATQFLATPAPPGGPAPELKGKMTLTLPIGKEGDVYDTLVAEDSKVQSPEMLRCAARRFRKLHFTLPPPEPPAPPPAPGEKAPEPPPSPKVLVTFDFKG